MKILVPVKRVVDYNVKVRVKIDGTGVDIANVKMTKLPHRWVNHRVCISRISNLARPSSRPVVR